MLKKEKDKDELERDTRQLEKWAGDLLLATEAIAEEERIVVSEQAKDMRPHQRIYVPVIVTTADIQIGVLDPSSISLDDGKLGEMRLEDEWVVRFHKNMATSMRYGSEVTSLELAHKANQRTVFIVQAKRFVEFLQKFWLA